MIKKILFFVLLLLVVFIGIFVFNTLTFKSKQPQVAAIKPIEIGQQSVINFQNAIRIKTVSFEDTSQVDTTQFSANLKFMETTYPNLNKTLKREVISKYSLLYTWPGKNPSLKPVVLMGHMDVVPVEEASLGKWKADPFGGEIKQDTIWGRGSVDDKITVITVMEAIEKLVSEGFQPEQTIYLAFGHDEEISGKEGASKIAALLKSRGVKAEFVMDEGGLIIDGIIPDKSIALVGTAEKGYLTIDLEVNASGGHSSAPGKETAIDILTSTITKIRTNPFKSSFTTPTLELVEYLGPEMPGFLKAVFANKWITKPLIQKEYEKTDRGAAQFHTTIAPTILKSGFKDNVLPTVATATINFRILPGETPETVLEHVKKAVNDPRVKITPRTESQANPSKISSSQAKGFLAIAKTNKQLNPDIPVSPFLLIAVTDSRYYADITDNIYRYVPSKLVGYHDVNERIAVKDYKGAIAFYYQMIKNLNEIK
ncbi:M20 family peptidase [Solitalea canadensis]|uniref:Acetylornithine deacetylase/succinyldiaminopimelate desuccinylase-like deacylase n=1 Tax=Solitalea canadensis (strain ATCC 29591 / DSM 3403 / JCM 21819 / LMG 8368 / NBRC 15130 / NCIMB 12057 / USAM 9D) TaxID=929556 RepID=H8KTJ6_SOLCM|nr:M20 family peptidase [Solitalea canadensis]AFD06454.1 acetylornithine deacetylase/succinyldiaminopimelate desuccinylase-like deacylase [Solitalea canadensis DSM 3403]